MNTKKTNLIQNYAKGLDLSPEGLRFYERRGIVHPVRDPETGYRYYSFKDTVAVTACRKMRCWGYSLEEASDALKAESFHEQSSSLQKHQEQFRKEIEYQKLVLTRLEEVDEVIANALDHLNEPQQVIFPSLAFLPTRIKEEAIRDKLLLKEINAWNKVQPFPEIVILNNGKENVTGLAMNQKYRKALDLPWHEEFHETKGTSLSLIQTMDELQSGRSRRKVEEILHRNLENMRIMIILLTASLAEQDMKILCRVLIPD